MSRPKASNRKTESKSKGGNVLSNDSNPAIVNSESEVDEKAEPGTSNQDLIRRIAQERRQLLKDLADR